MKRVFKFKNLVLLILGGVLIFSIARQEVEMKDIKKDISSKQVELQKLKEKNKILEEELKNANSDEYIEALARKRLDMVKPGEEVIKNKKGYSNQNN